MIIFVGSLDKRSLCWSDIIMSNKHEYDHSSWENMVLLNSQNEGSGDVGY